MVANGLIVSATIQPPHGLHLFAWMAIAREPSSTFVVFSVEQIRGEFGPCHALPLVIPKSETRMETLIAHPFLGIFLSRLVGHGAGPLYPSKVQGTAESTGSTSAAAIKYERLMQDIPSHSRCFADQIDRILVWMAPNPATISRQSQ